MAVNKRMFVHKLSDELPEAGIEPARTKVPRILSPVCLPISSLGQFEASAGIEPAIRALQAPALPLGDDAMRLFKITKQRVNKV